MPTTPVSSSTALIENRYDVFVIQTAGKKHWTTCIPQPKADGFFDKPDAMKAQAFEIETNNIKNSGSFED